eukprot:CAMPEP_0117456028 /NCGR_PEP_ID=MMETSP0759-20121206/11666_1 /TAXON_ID=63605 /ORGANISM="Percolomonas cosmopolitus, Strain WS" /LENGTH=296 /DNA_ID=CAMNT_0005249355 /DNA_START=154 /DNA_END=1040 /DNA_ORIENTATION=-
MHTTSSTQSKFTGLRENVQKDSRVRMPMIDTLTPLEPKIPPVPFTIQSTGPSYHLPSEDIEKKGVYSESAHEFNEETVKLPSEEITTTESPHDEIVEKEVVITSGLPEESREGHTSPKKAGLGAKIKGLFSSPEEKRGGMFSSMKKKRALHHEKKSHKHEVHESFGGVLSSSGAPDVVTPTEEGALGSTDETFEREDVAPDQWEREPPLVEERLETVPVGTTTLIEGETAEGVTKRPFGVSKQEESPLLKEDKKESIPHSTQALRKKVLSRRKVLLDPPPTLRTLLSRQSLLPLPL